jgi:ribose-phosphate pyrophosphokinase
VEVEMPNKIKASELVFNKKEQVAPLGIAALEGAKELSEKVNYYLVKWWNKSHFQDVHAHRAESEIQQHEDISTFLIPNECPRFSSGDGKGIIKHSVRGNDLYIIADVGNFSCKYRLFDKENSMSPDDHYQDLKRIIQAASGKAYRINVIMPILYGGRQHRRSYRESLDCAVALQELQNMGVENIITFDAHDSRVSNAVPLMGFDNIIPSYQVLKALFQNIEALQSADKDEFKRNFMVVSPDEGAMNRNMYYASVLGVDLGMFYKRRDYSTIVSGRNPIVAHEYLGNSVKDKVVFIADDIISSGESMLDIAYELKKRKAKHIVSYATYPLFTNGLDKFDKAYRDGIIDFVFGTNLTYRTPGLLSREWYHDVDISKYIAYLIAALNHDISTSKVIDPHIKIQHLLQSFKIGN